MWSRLPAFLISVADAVALAAVAFVPLSPVEQSHSNYDASELQPQASLYISPGLYRKQHCHVLQRVVACLALFVLIPHGFSLLSALLL